MDAQTKKPVFYTLDEVSEMLRIPKQTLYNMKCKGRLHGVKVGHLIRFSEDDLKQLIREF